MGEDEGHTRIPSTKCPGCGNARDCVTDSELKGAVPKPGDVSVCKYCGALAVFGDELVLRELTADEQRDIDNDPVVRRARTHLLMQRARLN